MLPFILFLGKEFSFLTKSKQLQTEKFMTLIILYIYILALFWLSLLLNFVCKFYDFKRPSKLLFTYWGLETWLIACLSVILLLSGFVIIVSLFNVLQLLTLITSSNISSDSYVCCRFGILHSYFCIPNNPKTTYLALSLLA